ncbi:MAG: bifunctional trehalose-phosphatase/glycoside hydrolase family 15 protein, partial [Phycisphaerales bacterium]|nr:bifunctional trehalose-phosphatase/glycoside hydrolase family 15 protein [Phycisphaerales bacterium]
RVAATAVLFVGDDLTDEDAFAVLRGPDAGVKVGPEPSRAIWRVRDTEEVARLLAALAELRAQWLAGPGTVHIEDHAVLSDQRTLALVTPHADITWLCLPRVDSPAMFAGLLGGPGAGSFKIGPADDRAPLGQGYVGDTFILRTRWPGLTVTDYLDCTGGRAFQRAGRSELVRVIDGDTAASVRFAPRVDFGRTPTRLRVLDGGLLVESAPDPVVLHSPGVVWRVAEEGIHQTAMAEIDPRSGPVVLELRYGTADLGAALASETARREQTHRFWHGWAATLRLPAIEPAIVRRSALALKALVYGPTGAIAAAGTTSLPEHIGGVRNWDYRYCWPRDAALAAAALVKLGTTGTAMKFLDWLLGVLEHIDSPERLRPIYTVTGRELGPEAEIGELSGYRGSRPVRVGNAAAQQVQLDVFGPIVDLVALLSDAGAPLSPEHWKLVEAMVRAVAIRWVEPDHGIWEERKPKQHHVHSKVMCWVTVDRGIRIGQKYLGKRFPEWEQLRSAIAADVLANGFKRELGAFTGTYEESSLDAAALHVGLSGLLGPQDPRFVSTVNAIAEGLRVGPTVYRYLHDDGLTGTEGGFHICYCWLIESYILLGRVVEARAMFQDYVQMVGPTGLIPEQFDPSTRTSLGNHPQAYSHLGLINTAIALSGTG